MSNKQKGAIGLTLGALGVVFGDIGTSPLYALIAVFGPLGLHLSINSTNVYGIISLIIWSVTLVVSIKYIAFIMRANNQGEGGIMALVSLIKASNPVRNRHWLLIIFGVIGVSLFYGDSAITPAISVLSAVEGLRIIAPNLSHIVIPLTLLFLTGLFWLQKYGTGIIGRLFGPVMLTWFAVIAAGGAWQIWQHPSIVAALSPLAAIVFFAQQPLLAFAAMGAIVLAVTGAEALYADMGHFGRKPIARGWFFVVFPALALCYMGQGAILLHNPDTVKNPLLLLFPSQLHVSVVLLATAATLIASQSVISGAFSLTRQAIQLGLLPKMLVRHTSTRTSGQIYVPFVNLLLFIVVIVLVLTFGSSARLANAYGIAVSGALAIDTILFIAVMRRLWHKSLRYVWLIAAIFVPIDLLFVTSSVPKVLHGGWFPITLAALTFVIIDTWSRGQRIIVRERKAMEGSLQEFIEKIRHLQPPLKRIPGTTVFIGHHDNFAPMAIHNTVEQLHELSEKVIIVFVSVTDQPHVATADQAIIDNLKYQDDGVSHVSLSYGFADTINVPKSLEHLRSRSSELAFDPKETSYFISSSRVLVTRRHNLPLWRKAVYAAMSRNAISTADYYKLPVERTVEMRALIKL